LSALGQRTMFTLGSLESA